VGTSWRRTVEEGMTGRGKSGSMLARAKEGLVGGDGGEGMSEGLGPSAHVDPKGH